jgi:hypothetical protein
MEARIVPGLDGVYRYVHISWPSLDARKEGKIVISVKEAKNLMEELGYMFSYLESQEKDSKSKGDQGLGQERPK